MATTGGGSDRERFLQRIQDTVDYCVRIGNSDALDVQILNSISGRLNSLCRDIDRCTGSLLTDEEAKEFLTVIEDIEGDIEGNQNHKSKEGFKAIRVPVDDKGHSRYDMTKEQLQFLTRYGFTAPMMCKVFKVSESTIRRRLRDFNITLRKVTTVTNEELDEMIKEVAGTNRLIGPNSIRVRLAERNIFVTRQRVRDGCARVDPGGCALRSVERKNIQRRTYKVAGPNSLWHLDGNHKLIRWGLVVHGCIDGYSRMVTFLKVSNNNKSITVYDNFIDAAKEFGTPSRVRCDYGGENEDVCVYMEGIRGENRGSAIRGKSSHNQRIERLWVDVWENVVNEFYDLFTYMELTHILDVTNTCHMYALQFVFVTRINESLQSFKFQYNNHPLSTEHNWTPNQLFIHGVLANAKSSLKSIEELVQDAGSTNDDYYEILLNDYGVEDVYSDDDLAEDVADIPTNDIHVSEDQLRELQEEIDPLSNITSLEYGVELFKKTTDILTVDADA